MASYFNLILDTLAPSGVSVSINSGAQYTTNTSVQLSIRCSDSDTTGYQMKIWGINGVATESAASWETYATSKTVTLPSGDGLKTVYIKVRDDVYNESTSASDSITLNTSVPTVTITGSDVIKNSKVAPRNVPSISSLESAGTTIGTANSSTNMSGTGTFKADTSISCTITGADLETASSGDGSKIIKVFVKNEAGTWSV